MVITHTGADTRVVLMPSTVQIKRWTGEIRGFDLIARGVGTGPKAGERGEGMVLIPLTPTRITELIESLAQDRQRGRHENPSQ